MVIPSEALEHLRSSKDPDRIVRDVFPRVAAHLGVDMYFNYMVSPDSGRLILHSYTGQEGLELATSAAPDIALIDIGLPGLDGYEVARCIRAAVGRMLTLVALTGYGTADDRGRAEQAGFDVHLVKPVDPDRLIALIAATPRWPA